MGKQLKLSVACDCSGDSSRVGGGVWGHPNWHQQCSWNPRDHFWQCVHLPDFIFLEMSVRPYYMDRNGNIIENSIWKGVFIHEIFHVFGIAHTQRRSDRESYVEVLWDNIIKDKHFPKGNCQGTNNESCGFKDMPQFWQRKAH